MPGIATIGCGLIGQSWATVFAQYGFDVSMYDPSPAVSEKAINAIETRIADLVEFGLIESSQSQAVLQRISFADNLERALDGVVSYRKAVRSRSS